MTRSDRHIVRFAAVAVLALALAACGRKGPLDPPAAAAPPPGQTAEQNSPPPPDKGPSAARKSFFLDWLID